MTPRTLVVAAFLAALAVAAPGVADTVVSPARAQAPACTINGQPCDTNPSDATLQYGAARMGVLGVVSNSVNGQAGSVVLPTYSRWVNPTPIPVDAAGGVTFTGTFPTPSPFINLPSCQTEVMSTATGVSFTQPQTVTRTLQGVTVKFRAVPDAATIGALGAALPLTIPPPAGTTVNFTCIAPN